MDEKLNGINLWFIVQFHFIQIKTEGEIRLRYEMKDCDIVYYDVFRFIVIVMVLFWLVTRFKNKRNVIEDDIDLELAKTIIKFLLYWTFIGLLDQKRTNLFLLP